MASPQLENGYTRIANEIVEALAKLDLGYSGTGHALILFVLRKTYGFNKKEDKISISQIQEALNLSRRTIIYSLQELEAKNILIIKRERTGLKNEINLIKFNKDYDTWVVQNSASQVEKNRNRAKISSAKLRQTMGGSAKLRQTMGGSAKLRQKVVQNSEKKVRSFAPTKDNTKDNTKEKSFSRKRSKHNSMKTYNENTFSDTGEAEVDMMGDGSVKKTPKKTNQNENFNQFCSYFVKEVDKKQGSAPIVGGIKDKTTFVKIRMQYSVDEMRDIIKFFLTLKKAEENPTITACFSNHTLSLWKKEANKLNRLNN